MIGKHQATVATWLQSRQFGFLFSEELDRRVFFHISHWHRGSQPIVGEIVTFNLKPSAIAGKEDKAIDVWPANTVGISALASGGQ